jgi:hypothetical protein
MAEGVVAWHNGQRRGDGYFSQRYHANGKRNTVAMVGFAGYTVNTDHLTSLIVRQHFQSKKTNSKMVSTEEDQHVFALLVIFNTTIFQANTQQRPYKL